jgi:hypothetical protein
MKRNIVSKTLFTHPDYPWYSIYTYDYKLFFVELNQPITHSYNSFDSAMEALNYQL